MIRMVELWPGRQGHFFFCLALCVADTGNVGSPIETSAWLPVLQNIEKLQSQPTFGFAVATQKWVTVASLCPPVCIVTQQFENLRVSAFSFSISFLSLFFFKHKVHQSKVCLFVCFGGT